MRKKHGASRSFVKQVMTLSLSACIVSTLILGIGQAFLSGRYFSEQARNDIDFYMEKTNLEFDNHVKNMAKMIVSFRNNITLREFLAGDDKNMDQVHEAFNVSADLYSERNMVDAVHPFVGSVYLFNKKGKWISSQAYPQTFEQKYISEVTFKEINQNFKNSKQEYKYIPTEKCSYICTRVYDDRMNVTGSCIMTIETEAVEHIFESANRYPNQIWFVLGANGELLFSNERGKQLIENAAAGEQKNEKRSESADSRYMLDSHKTDFGMNSKMLVGKQNVYQTSMSMLMPFAVMFVLVIAVAAVVVFLFAVRISRPIKLMGEDIKQFGDGNANGQMREFGITEFDEVSHLYNKMTGEIKDLIGQVYEKQLLATQAQVKYLQSQINPHFMFNILSMMGMRAGLNGDKEIQKLLSAFAKLMQGKIFRRGETEIPLSKEIEIVEFYLLLQSERFAGKITYKIDCEKEVMDACIPRLLIEPMVENAVAHGLEPKEEKGYVNVTARKKNDKLWIQIEDNGVGFNVEELADKEQIMADEKHTHIGLEITRQMLKTIYKEEASMEVQSKIGEGTTVTISIPFERGNSNVEGNDCR